MHRALYALTITMATLLAGPALAQTANSSSGAIANANASASTAARAGAEARGGNASNANNFRYNQKNQAPGIGLAGLAAGGLSCRGSVSAGVSFPGGGFGFGTTVADDECERRQWGSMLASARDPRARALAWAIMARSQYVKQAMQDTGIGGADVTVGVAVVPVAARAGTRGRAAGCARSMPGNPTLCLD